MPDLGVGGWIFVVCGLALGAMFVEGVYMGPWWTEKRRQRRARRALGGKRFWR